MHLSCVSLLSHTSTPFTLRCSVVHLVTMDNFWRKFIKKLWFCFHFHYLPKFIIIFPKLHNRSILFTKFNFAVCVCLVYPLKSGKSFSLFWSKLFDLRLLAKTIACKPKSLLLFLQTKRAFNCTSSLEVSDKRCPRPDRCDDPLRSRERSLKWSKVFCLDPLNAFGLLTKVSLLKVLVLCQFSCFVFGEVCRFWITKSLLVTHWVILRRAGCPLKEINFCLVTD